MQPSHPHTLSPAARLRARSEILAVQRSGRRMEGACFVTCAKPSPAGQARLGVTVSRRVGGAVARNRIKRLVREVFRKNRAALGVPLDVVVIARPAAAEAPRERAEADLLALFLRAGRAAGGGGTGAR